MYFAEKENVCLMECIIVIVGKPTRRGSCGSLDSGMSVSFHSDELHQQNPSNNYAAPNNAHSGHHAQPNGGNCSHPPLPPGAVPTALLAGSHHPISSNPLHHHQSSSCSNSSSGSSHSCHK